MSGFFLKLVFADKPASTKCVFVDAGFVITQEHIVLGAG
jgi:hypothetical protein